MNTLLVILEAGFLASALSIDAFAASFAYGSNKIKIPFLSAQIINLICTAILGLSLFIGTLVKQLIPSWLTTAICFTLLLVLGLIKLLDSLTKTISVNITHRIKNCISASAIFALSSASTQTQKKLTAIALKRSPLLRQLLWRSHSPWMGWQSVLAPPWEISMPGR